MNGWRKDLDIDRFDNDSGYSPDNCRIATRSENMLNSRLLCASNTTGFRGVHWNKVAKKYRAMVQVEGVQHILGMFVDAVTAAKVRDDFVVKRSLHSPLNFPKREE